MKSKRKKISLFLSMALIISLSAASLFARAANWPIGSTGGTGSLSINGVSNTAATSGSPHYKQWTTTKGITFKSGKILNQKSSSGYDHSFTNYSNGTSTEMTGHFSVDGVSRIEGIRR